MAAGGYMQRRNPIRDSVTRLAKGLVPVGAGGVVTEEEPITGNYTLTAADNGRRRPVTVGSLTVTIPSYATLGAGFECELVAILPFTLDGTVTRTIFEAETALVRTVGGAIIVPIGGGTVFG